jgi:hypothetical protein
MMGTMTNTNTTVAFPRNPEIGHALCRQACKVARRGQRRRIVLAFAQRYLAGEPLGGRDYVRMARACSKRGGRLDSVR